jgi:hypothetical protein
MAALLPALPDLPLELPQSTLESLVDLTSQQRNLVLFEKLFDIRSNRTRISDEAGDRGSFEELDTHALVLGLFDYLIEGAELDIGRTRPECLQHLKSRVVLQAPLLSRPALEIAAEYVLSELENHKNEYKPFEARYFNWNTGSWVELNYKLIRTEIDSADVVRLKLTRQGYLIVIGMLDLSPQDQEVVFQQASSLLIQRGKYKEAAFNISQARKAFGQFMAELRADIQAAQRNSAEVAWSATVTPRIRSARELIDSRRKEDDRQRVAVLERLNAEKAGKGDSKVTTELYGIIGLLNAVMDLRRQLDNELQQAHTRYLAANENAFKVRKRSSLGDATRALSPGLGALTSAQFLPFADAMIYGLFPTKEPKLFSLAAILPLLAPIQRRTEEPTIPEDEDLVESDIPDATFTTELDHGLKRQVEAALSELLGVHKKIEIRQLLEHSNIALLPERQRYLATVWVYRQFQLDRKTIEVTAHGHFRNELIAGTNLTFESKDPTT